MELETRSVDGTMAQWFKNVATVDGLNRSTHYPSYWNVFSASQLGVIT